MGNLGVPHLYLVLLATGLGIGLVLLWIALILAPSKLSSIDRNLASIAVHLAALNEQLGAARADFYHQSQLLGAISKNVLAVSNAVERQAAARSASSDSPVPGVKADPVPGASSITAQSSEPEAPSDRRRTGDVFGL